MPGGGSNWPDGFQLKGSRCVFILLDEFTDSAVADIVDPPRCRRDDGLTQIFDNACFYSLAARDYLVPLCRRASLLPPAASAPLRQFKAIVVNCEISRDVEEIDCDNTPDSPSRTNMY